MFNKKIAMLVGACGAVLGFILTLLAIILNYYETKYSFSFSASGASLSAPGTVWAVIGMIIFIATICFLAFYLFKKGIKKNIALGVGAGGAVLGLVFAIIGIASNTSETASKAGAGNPFTIISLVLFLAASCFLTFLAKKDQ